MALLLNTQFLRLAAWILALLTAQVSTHSLEKRNVPGDKLYVLFKRSSCVAVESLDGCPVSWKLPPVFAMYYKLELNYFDSLFNDNKAYAARCINAMRETHCAHISPKCLPDGGEDFGDSRTQCQNYNNSTCPSNSTNAFKSGRYCEQYPTGKHDKAACVAPILHIRGTCPQPKYKMPADLLEYFKRDSLILVKIFPGYENLNDSNGKRLLSTRCLNLIKEFFCLTIYCSKDGERLLTEFDYEDCEETRECYRKLYEDLKKAGHTDLQIYTLTLGEQYQSLREFCPVLPRRGTDKLEAALQLYDETPQKSEANGSGKFPKILFLFVGAIYAAISV